ncbi:putative NUC153 domain-containing protein [Seiridium unicorne]|uniref:NUC153 domain-containing protein n=1 Tax=Seiridium unicorne TaxID=138068 RepID=A0ABR2VBT2_9PEZI
MKAEKVGDVSVYTVAGAETARPLPDWLARRRKRSLKNDAEYQSRIELLQDFEFEEASQCIRVSDDGEWLMSTGTYKPQIHVHQLSHLSLSFARHTTSLNTTFQLLSSDYTKSIHLQSDRKIELHTQGALHYETRIPRYGRDLIYDRHSAEALVPAVGLDADGHGEVFRLNLEVGRFMKSYHIDLGTDEGVEKGLQGSIDVGAVLVAAQAESTHNLAAFGTSIGTIEFWDPRSKNRVSIIGGQEGEITALNFSDSGLSLATGSSNGLIKLFDLRSPVPMLTKDQGLGFPVKELMHLTTASQEKKILSADKRVVKIWDEHDGKPWTSVEPLVDINSVAWCKDTGMLLSANEGKQQHAWFIPELGPAPKWASFLDNMVDEMAEEVRTETYENYKFLTRPELKSLSLDHLIGKTSLLRPYMHGYFVASKLYDQARLIANPYAWEEERTKRIKEKIDKERESRIRGKKKVKVNQKLVDNLLKRQERRAQPDLNAGVLGDERFGKIFEDEEFAIDENTFEFRTLNPSTKVDGASGAAARSDVKASGVDTDSDSASSSGDEVAAPRRSGGKVDMKISSSNRSGGRSMKDTALGSRAQKGGRVTKNRAADVVGERSVTFVPESRRKQRTEQVTEPEPQAKRWDARRSASTNTFRRM